MKRALFLLVILNLIVAQDSLQVDSLKVVESKTDMMQELPKISSFYASGINTPSFFLSRHITPKVALANKSNMLFSFFTTACLPCKKEIPFLQQCTEKYNIEKSWLINIGDKKEQVKKYLEINQYDMKVLHDPFAAVSKRLKIESTPSMIIVSGDGELLYRHDGFNEKDTAEIRNAIQTHFSKESE